MPRLAEPTLDFDWITRQLAIGGHFPSEAAALLAERHGIRHVVDLRAESCDDAQLLRRHGIELLHLPTPDHAALEPSVLESAVAWVERRITSGRRVLIHCQHGIGRSSLLALCVLVALGMAPLEALALAKDRRARVSPSPAQLEAFIAWAERYRAATRAEWTRPSFEALAEIAYRHIRRPDDGRG